VGMAGLLVAGFALGGAATCVALAMVALVPMWRRGKTMGRLLICGLAALFVLIPCYTPFARLALPWIVLVQVGAGVGMQEIWNCAESWSLLQKQSRAFAGAMCLMSIAAMPLAGGKLSFARVDPWNSPPKDTMRRAVTAMSKMLPPGSIVFVDEEPDAAFYFRRAGFNTLCTVRLFDNANVPDAFQDLPEYAGAPNYVVAGPYAQEAPDWHPIPPDIRARLNLVARFVTQPGDVRLLDDYSPQDALKYREHPDDRYDLLLFRVAPAVADPPRAANAVK
jgi:hypothetical protein